MGDGAGVRTIGAWIAVSALPDAQLSRPGAEPLLRAALARYVVYGRVALSVAALIVTTACDTKRHF